VWYSKVTEGSPLYPSGYFATLWHATSTDGGRHWQERGEAIGKGDLEAFDSFGVFTPNILFHGRRYYLYFSKDGIRFRMIAATVKGNVHAPGGFRPELTSHTYDQGVRWGISMVHARDPYLVRWSMDVPESLVSNDE
jgi:hypothetical protein